MLRTQITDKYFLSSWQDASAENAEGQQGNTIIFNSSKGELFTPNNGFKSLVRKLRSNWKVITYVTAFFYLQLICRWCIFASSWVGDYFNLIRGSCSNFVNHVLKLVTRKRSTVTHLDSNNLIYSLTSFDNDLSWIFDDFWCYILVKITLLLTYILGTKMK